MKKLLIISYFFPPSNFAGSYRIESFAKYLPENGWKPIVITRGWQPGQTVTYFPSPNQETIVEDSAERTVIRLPFKGNLRDRIYARCKNNPLLNLAARLLSFLEILFQNFIRGFYPYNDFYHEAMRVLRSDPEIQTVLISGRPFQQFKIGFLLKKKFPSIKWIADYRDEWSTHQWIVDQSLKDQFIGWVDYYFEKRWMKNAHAFITCSENWKNNIERFTGVKGQVVLNGYEEEVREVFMQKSVGKREAFTIVHNGTLYSSQPVNEFLSAFKKFVDKGQKADVLLLFPGILNESEQAKRIVDNLRGYERYYRMMQRIPKQEVIEMQSSASILLMFGTKREIKGHYSSKIFEYLAAGKPILLYPTDHDVIEELLKKTGAGHVLSEESEVLQFLEDEYRRYQDDSRIQFVDNRDISFYSRRTQAQILSEFLDKETARAQAENPVFTFRNNLFRAMDRLHVDRAMLTMRHKHTLVLCMHRVSDEVDEANPPLCTRAFKKFVDRILKNYTPCSLSDLANPPKTNRVLFTYDDGYKDWKDNAMPVHLQKGIPAVLFVVSETVRSRRPIWTQLLAEAVKSKFRQGKPIKVKIGGRTFQYTPADNTPEQTSLELFELLLPVPLQEKLKTVFEIGERGFEKNCPGMLAEADVREITRHNFEIGSHSYFHENYKILTPGEIRRDMLDSKTYLESLTGKPCLSFAFPNGLFTSDSVELAHQVGFKFVFGTRDNILKNGAVEKILPRVSIYHQDPVESYYKALLVHGRLKRFLYERVYERAK
ncbi:MAG TPA: polysaccharide deacetylase family protein [Chitinophagales bacterium]|nr:polysaccharide deacetylase family protein [Chitinophagales bacterium]